MEIGAIEKASVASANDDERRVLDLCGLGDGERLHVDSLEGSDADDWLKAEHDPSGKADVVVAAPPALVVVPVPGVGIPRSIAIIAGRGENRICDFRSGRPIVGVVLPLHPG